MKKMIGLLMSFVPIIFMFISASIGSGKATPTPPVAHIIYMAITIAMFWGITDMLTDKNKVPKMTNWTRVADVNLLILFVITATNDFLHRHNANVTATNSTLMLFCCAMIYLHEKVRDQRVAKLLEATKLDNKKTVLVSQRLI